ncbi:MAG: NAD(P)/FAD-dependent oxidoreductase [Candidatus Sulfotelmatobacter sp.]
MPAHAKADVIIIGAGASGIAAATALASAGFSITLLEARDRIGGRIFTLQDPKLRAPIELGAEFIHGLPPEIWDLLQSRHVQIREVDGDNWCVEEDGVSPCNFFSDVDRILQKMREHTNGDESFTDFIKHYSSRSPDTPTLRRAKQWATGYVSGFNAADPALVSVNWLLQGMRAEEQIEGDRAFRAEHGYADLIEIFQQQLQDSGVSLQKNTIVESIQWSPGQVDITASSTNGAATFSAPRALITVPLGVLQAQIEEKGAIHFIPELPQQKQDAIQNIAMGKVIRVTLRFRERFWKDLPYSREKDFKSMDGMSFLLSHDDWFPTWWTTAPVKLPLLTGWAPFHCASRLSGHCESFVIEHTIATLHHLLGVSVQELETLLEHAYFHDWQTDPFSRGAYSYGKVGGDQAPQALAIPVDNTLFFAGEATDTNGLNGTVHAAIASGRRAAVEIASSAKVKVDWKSVKAS